MKNNRWIILRGLGRGAGHWGLFPKELKKAFPRDHFYFLDLPGNGTLNHLTSPLRISDYIPFLEDQLKQTDYFEHEGPTLGIGLSLGGMVLTEWALRKPKRFSKIVLLNTSSCNFSFPWRRLTYLVLLSALKQKFRKAVEEFELNSLLITTSLSKEQIQSEFKEGYQSNINFTKKYPISKQNVNRQLVAAFRYFFPQKPPVPAVLITGAKDRFVAPVCTEDIHKKWKSPFHLHPTAGHDIAFEDSEWLIKKLGESVSNLDQK